VIEADGYELQGMVSGSRGVQERIELDGPKL
jgi:hypothetical protein